MEPARKKLFKNDFDLKASVAKTPLQLDIIRAVWEMEAIRSNMLHAIIPSPKSSFNDRLTRMHDHGLITKPPEQLENGANLYHSHIYASAPRGLQMLDSAQVRPYRFIKTYRPRGSQGYRIEWHHTLGISDTIAGIRAGAIPTGCRIVPQEEIEVRQLGTIPEYPLSLPARIEGTYKGISQLRDVRAVPDATFGITYPHGKTSFFLLEYQNTGATNRTDLKASSVYKKLLAYNDILSRQTYKAEWGLPNVRAVLFVFGDEGLYREAMNLAAKLDIDHAKFWFYYLPRNRVAPNSGFLLSPVPAPEIFTDGWKRPGLEDEYLFNKSKLPG